MQKEYTKSWPKGRKEGKEELQRIGNDEWQLAAAYDSSSISRERRTSNSPPSALNFGNNRLITTCALTRNPNYAHELAR